MLSRPCSRRVEKGGGGGGGGINGGATAADGRYHVHAPQCWFDGKRVSKVNAFNNEQEKYLGQRISTARLARVQEAIKQLKENNRVGAEKASGGAAVAQGKPREVLLVGHDYAFVFENGIGKSTVEIGRLEICAQWVVIT